MKKYLVTSISLIVVSVSLLLAGEPFPLYLSNIDTNATATTTNASATRVTGELEGIHLNFSGTANPTCNVSIVTTTNGGFQTQQTLLSLTGVSADGYYPVRDKVTDNAGTTQTNEFARYQLWSDSVEMSVNSCVVTGANLRAIIVLK